MSYFTSQPLYKCKSEVRHALVLSRAVQGYEACANKANSRIRSIMALVFQPDYYTFRGLSALEVLRAVLICLQSYGPVTGSQVDWMRSLDLTPQRNGKRLGSHASSGSWRQYPLIDTRMKVPQQNRSYKKILNTATLMRWCDLCNIKK